MPATSQPTTGTAGRDDGSQSVNPLRLLTDPLFGPFFAGKLLSSLGIWIHSIIAVIVAFELTRSALAVGVVGGLMFVPQLGLAPVCGRIADRGHAVGLVVTGRLLMALGSGGLALWIWAVGSVRQLPGVAVVAGLSVVVGLGLAVSGPAMEGLLGFVVHQRQLAIAVSLNSIPMIVGRAAGPALGAFGAAWLGVAGALMVAAALSAVHAAIMLGLRLRQPRREGSDESFSVWAALRYVRNDMPLMLLLAGITVIGFAADQAITLVPALATALGAGDRLIGSMASAFGIGTVVGLAAFASLHRRLTMVLLGRIGLFLMAASTVVLATVRITSVDLVALGISGAGMMLGYTSVTAQIQHRTPDALRGRIMSLWLVGFVGSRPVAALINGVLADAVSLEVAFWLTATITALAAWLCCGRRVRDAGEASRRDAGPLPAVSLVGKMDRNGTA